MLKRWLDGILRPRDPNDELSIVATGEAAVEAAVAEARASLPVFWDRFDAGAADSFQLKVGLTSDHGGAEHIWIEPIRRESGRVVGRLMNRPSDISDVDLGDEVEVDSDRISDWGYAKAGMLYGAFTQRALLHTLSPNLRRKIQAALSPAPLETASN